MNFYRVSTMAGTFWIEATRASDAYRQVARMLGHDEFTLTRETDIGYLPEVVPA